MSSKNLRVLDESDSNMLVQHPDGSVENVSMSPLNRLLFDHGLWGLLREGNEVASFSSGPRDVTIIPGEDAREYTLEVGDTEELHIGEHQKAALVDALHEVYDGGRDATPLVELYDDLRAEMVRRRVVNFIGENPPFSTRIEKRKDGWFINDHLLLTYDNEFIHPGTTSRRRSGGVTNYGSAQNAYQLTLGQASAEERTVTMDGEKYRLTNAEMEFVARAMWAMKQTPRN